MERLRRIRRATWPTVIPKHRIQHNRQQCNQNRALQTRQIRFSLKGISNQQTPCLRRLGWRIMWVGVRTLPKAR